MISDGPKKVVLVVPAEAEFVGIVRLAVSGIASRMGFGVGDIEDIKVAVSEACTNVVQHAYRDTVGPGSITVEALLRKDHLDLIIEDGGLGFNYESHQTGSASETATSPAGGLGITFMKTLMDEVHYAHNEPHGTRVHLIKNLTETPAVRHDARP